MSRAQVVSIKVLELRCIELAMQQSPRTNRAILEMHQATFKMLNPHLVEPEILNTEHVLKLYRHECGEGTKADFFNWFKSKYLNT